MSFNVYTISMYFYKFKNNCEKSFVPYLPPSAAAVGSPSAFLIQRGCHKIWQTPWPQLGSVWDSMILRQVLLRTSGVRMSMLIDWWFPEKMLRRILSSFQDPAEKSSVIN